MKIGKLTIFLVGGLVIALAIAAETNALTFDGKPVLSNETPINGSINVALNPTLSIYVEDPDGDLMNITINVTNADGGYWAVTYYNVGNGTYSYNLGHIGTYGKTYYWKVSAYDGEYYTNETYHFTTIGLVVNQNTSEEYHTIQDAINNASNGNIIVVHDGIYKENVVVNKSVVIMNGSKPVIDGHGGVAFNITANNVSIIGFNITNSSYGIKCNASGFYIANNTFWYDRIGFRWNIGERPSEDYTIYDGIIEKNEFYMNQDYYAIFAYINLNYSKNGPYNVTIGNITIWDNTFYMNGSDAIGVHISEEIGDLCGGNISAGTVNISNNKIYGGWGAVDFSGDFYDLTDVNVSAGDVIINKNIMLNQLLGGVSTDYYSAGLWNGNTTGVYGDLLINGNKIYSSSLGIYISLEYFGAIMHDNATAVLGFTNISNNIINSGKHGIYFYAGYLGYEMYDNASAGVGKFIIHNNNITANDNYDGIHIRAEYWGYNMSHNSSCNIGNFKITKNNVNCKNGTYFEYFHYVGCNLSDNASVIIGDFAINDNIINASEYGVHEAFDYWGHEMRDDSSIIIGNFSFNGNKIKAGSDGIYLYPEDWATDMYDNSVFCFREL
ncbi:MAG: hypothetical protein FE044_00210 [Thermoplasmata archaeon]|nr:MAG: hypothetical protein FE044_00210 [Thermoplasmata archaeon]